MEGEQEEKDISCSLKDLLITQAKGDLKRTESRLDHASFQADIG